MVLSANFRPCFETVRVWSRRMRSSWGRCQTQGLLFVWRTLHLWTPWGCLSFMWASFSCRIRLLVTYIKDIVRKRLLSAFFQLVPGLYTRPTCVLHGFLQRMKTWSCFSRNWATMSSLHFILKRGLRWLRLLFSSTTHAMNLHFVGRHSIHSLSCLMELRPVFEALAPIGRSSSLVFLYDKFISALDTAR